MVVGSGGTATILDTGFGPLSGFGFDADPGSSWNFQLWLRQGGRLSFSNALYVLFCP